MKQLTFIFLFCLGILTGCYYDNEEELYPSTGPCVTESMSYANDILPVLQSQCLNCHSAAVNSGNVTLEGYTNLKIYVDNGFLLGVIRRDGGYSPMPKGSPKMDDCTIAKFEAWVQQGALDN